MRLQIHAARLSLRCLAIGTRPWPDIESKEAANNDFAN